MKSPLLKLLRRNVSALQIAGYIVASLLGFSILAVGVRFWSDAAASSHTVSAYTVIQPRVAASLFGADTPRFTPAEIDEIASQPWARRVGAFATADFDVYARVSGMGREMSTALFLEAVPDSFMDVHPSDWGFTPGRTSSVPVVLPREYLSLYNYGFAPARGLPQVSEEMIGLIPIELSVSGNGRQQLMRAHVAGFSSRVNTIAVPVEFIRWANGEFGGGADAAPSRLIVEMSRPADPGALSWIESKGYETTADSASARIGTIASASAAVVLVIGAVIVALALFIITLSLHLLLYKNRPMLTSCLR